MMESSSLEEESIIKNVRNLVRLKKETDDNTIKDIFLDQKNEIKQLEIEYLEIIRNLFEHEGQEENFYKPVKVSNFWSNNYIDYESKGEKKKHYQLKNILIKLDHKYIIDNLKKSDTWKIQLTVSINFVSSKDNDEERLMHSKSDKTEIMINDKADEVIEEYFDSVIKKYQIGLEKISERC